MRLLECFVFDFALQRFVHDIAVPPISYIILFLANGYFCAPINFVFLPSSNVFVLSPQFLGHGCA